jgi:peptidoglycan/xylan/chitin deacetylase (PgdA/CDA1 family)
MFQALLTEQGGNWAMKDTVYKWLGRFGLFWFARLFFKNQLLILSYHGISIQDEHKWGPGVFMTESRFRQRLHLLRSRGYNVLDLSEALDRLDNGTLPPRAVVITADDGYLNSPQTLAKACADFDFPLTIYVTTYHSATKTPIFNVMVQYLLWKTDKTELNGDFSKLGLSDTQSLDLSDQAERRAVAQQVIAYGRECGDENRRQEILKELCAQTDLDYQAMNSVGMFRIMDAATIRTVAGQGVDIQLHTHRHRFPADKADACREIEENRLYLEPLVGKPLTHFCYPSGLWEEAQLPWLKELGVESATTCQLGFVSPDSNRLCLNRYLDKDDISESEFLAEVSGFLGFARRLRKRILFLWR